MTWEDTVPYDMGRHGVHAWQPFKQYLQWTLDNSGLGTLQYRKQKDQAWVECLNNINLPDVQEVLDGLGEEGV